LCRDIGLLVEENSKRIPELDGIRGLAIAMVVVYHDLFIPTAFPAGSVGSYLRALARLSWTGVDLFFVLSGFLIGGILLDSREAPNYFRVFYTRRFFRIIPLYAALLACVYIFVEVATPKAIDTYGWGLFDRHSFLPYLFFLQNFSMAASNYITFMGVTWSLAVEEQFYLVMPFLIRVFSKRRLLWLIAAGICAAPVTRVMASRLWLGHPLASYLLTPCRMDALLFGVVGAYLVRQDTWRTSLERRPNALKCALAVLLAGMAIFTKYGNIVFFQHLMVSIGFTWIAAFYLCGLLYAVTQPASWLSTCLRWKPLRWLGAIAYGVYLVHGYALNFVYGVLYSHPLYVISRPAELIAPVLAMVGTLVLCRLSWLYFEKPMIQLGREVQFRSAPALISGFRLNDQLISVGFQPAQPSRTYVRPLVRIIPNRAVRIDGGGASSTL